MFPFDDVIMLRGCFIGITREIAKRPGNNHRVSIAASGVPLSMSKQKSYFKCTWRLCCDTRTNPEAWSVTLSTLLHLNGAKITDDNFKCNIVNENVFVSTSFSFKFIPQCIVDERSSLV